MAGSGGYAPSAFSSLPKNMLSMSDMLSIVHFSTLTTINYVDDVGNCFSKSFTHTHAIVL